MSLYLLMVCSRKDGGCGHARHRHTKATGNTLGLTTGACRTEGSDGRCECLKFRDVVPEPVQSER